MMIVSHWNSGRHDSDRVCIQSRCSTSNSHLLQSVYSLGAPLPTSGPPHHWSGVRRLPNLKGSVGVILIKSSSMRIFIALDLSTRSFIPLPHFLRSHNPPLLLSHSLVPFPPCTSLLSHLHPTFELHRLSIPRLCRRLGKETRRSGATSSSSLSYPSPDSSSKRIDVVTVSCLVRLSSSPSEQGPLDLTFFHTPDLRQ